MKARIDEIQNSVAMKKVIGYKGQSFSHAELKEVLLDVQNQLLHTTFEKKHADNLNYNDLYSYFKTIASEYNLQDDAHYLRFESGLTTIKNTIGMLISGEIGEKRVSKALRLMELDGAAVLFNVELQATEIDRTEIDCLLVDHSGIHMLEVKNYHGEIEINEAGEVIEIGRQNRAYPINVKNGEKEFAVKKILKDAGINVLNGYESILVLSDNKTIYQDNYGCIPVCNAWNLVTYLRDKKEMLFTDEEIKKIADIIKSANCPQKYTWELVDFEELVEDYAYLMAYIEAASKDDYEKTFGEPYATEFDNEEVVKKESCISDKKKEIGRYFFSAICGAAITATVFLIAGQETAITD